MYRTSCARAGVALLRRTCRMTSRRPIIDPLFLGLASAGGCLHNSLWCRSSLMLLSVCLLNPRNCFASMAVNTPCTLQSRSLWSSGRIIACDTGFFLLLHRLLHDWTVWQIAAHPVHTIDLLAVQDDFACTIVNLRILRAGPAATALTSDLGC